MRDDTTNGDDESNDPSNGDQSMNQSIKEPTDPSNDGPSNDEPGDDPSSLPGFIPCGAMGCRLPYGHTGLCYIIVEEKMRGARKRKLPQWHPVTQEQVSAMMERETDDTTD